MLRQPVPNNLDKNDFDQKQIHVHIESYIVKKRAVEEVCNFFKNRFSDKTEILQNSEFLLPIPWRILLVTSV